MAKLIPGTFPAVVVSTQLGETDNDNATPYLLITFDINNEGKPDDPKGRMSHSGWLTEGAAQYTMKALADLGWDPREKGYDSIFNELDKGEDSPLVGAECDLVLDMDEYQGERRLRIKFINRKGGGVRKALNEDAKRRLAATLSAWDVREEEEGGGAPPAEAGGGGEEKPKTEEVPW